MSNPIRYIKYGDGRPILGHNYPWGYYLAFFLFALFASIAHFAQGTGNGLDAFLNYRYPWALNQTLYDVLYGILALEATSFLFALPALRRNLGVAKEVEEEERAALQRGEAVQAESRRTGRDWKFFGRSYGWGFYLVFFLLALFASFSHMVQGVETGLDIFLSTGLPWPPGAALYDALYVLLGLYAVFCLISFPNLKRSLGIARAEEEKEEQEEARWRKAARERAAEQAAKESAGNRNPPA